MIYLRTTCFILLAFALHIGCTALVHVGWPPQPLVIVTVLAVWLERSPALGRTVLPAALLVDVLQPTRVPLVTFAVLVAWFVAALVQRQWLTNRSLASLFGLGVLSLLAAGEHWCQCHAIPQRLVNAGHAPNLCHRSRRRRALRRQHSHCRTFLPAALPLCRTLIHSTSYPLRA